MNIPQALADLLNKTNEEWVVFAHMVPSRIFRVCAKKDFCSFVVEQFSRTNRDNFNPKGMWTSCSPVYYDPTPGRMCQTACDRAMKEQAEFIKRNQAKLDARVRAQIKRVQQQ